MSNNFRALCTDLLAQCDAGELASVEAMEEIRAALAQPEGQGPTLGEIEKLTWQHASDLGDLRIGVAPEDVPALVYAALARWGHPTAPPAPEPVAVSERPWEKGGWTDLDGECWWYPPDGPAYWSMANPAMVYGGWLLPAHAIPFPHAGEVEG